MPVTVGLPQLSLAVGVPGLTLAEQTSGSVLVVMFAGQVIVGFSVSLTVTVNEQVPVLFDESVAMQVTVVTPF